MENKDLIRELQQLYPSGEVYVMVDGNIYPIERIDEDTDGTTLIYVEE